MALAVRLLSRRATTIGVSLLSSNPAHSCASSPVASSAHATRLSRCRSTFFLPNALLGRRIEVVRFLSLWRLAPFGRVYSTGVVEGGLGEQKEDTVQTVVDELKAPIKPPGPFKLNNEQRELADEIGYKVVDRYTEEDFGLNKLPKAFAVVQIGSHQFKVSPKDLIYTEKLKYCDINDKLMLNKVLMLGSKDQTIIGQPTVPKAAVFGVVEEHSRKSSSFIDFGS